ncbi:hypothetical protein [Methylotuvimicrobium buryatense]|uniref:hypothetical protein n=1 Tax=Methylotuvimicrobium buryatense TaxID=95641 RepID=UPI00034A3F05|nr:hypothetical protein [Methylotuvimicrobium buryatense]
MLELIDGALSSCMSGIRPWTYSPELLSQLRHNLQLPVMLYARFWLTILSELLDIARWLFFQENDALAN